MTYKSFLFFRRVFRWSIYTYFCNANDFSHSLSMQLTPGRRTIQFHVTKTVQPAAMLGLARRS
jgi:hypothetical protein